MKSRLLDVHGESDGLAGREPRLSENQMRKRQAAISGRGRTACNLSEECGFLPLVHLCEALPVFSPHRQASYVIGERCRGPKPMRPAPRLRNFFVR